MTHRSISPRPGWLATLALLAGIGVAMASAAPDWAGDPGTTETDLPLDTDETSPDVPDGPFGPVEATVTLGPFAAGWQDPADPFALSGVDADGAWELGSEGSILVQLPVAPTPLPPGDCYRVDFVVHVVAYAGIGALPELSVAGMTVVSLDLDSGVVAEDPIFPGASWNFRTWTGVGFLSGSPSVGFHVDALANGAVVDSVRIFTRYALIEECSPPQIVRIEALPDPDTFLLHYDGTAGATYEVFSSGVLDAWTPAGFTESTGAGSTVTVTAEAGAARQFWRLAPAP